MILNDYIFVKFLLKYLLHIEILLYICLVKLKQPKFKHYE